MKQVTAAILAVTMLATAATAADSSLKDTKDKLGYGIGLDMGKTFKKQGLEINPDALLKGFKDGFSGAEPKLSEEEIKATFTAVQQEMAKKQMEEATKISAKNSKEGADFLAANKKKAGITTTASGLQYKVITAGKGPKPAATSIVKAHYRGTLLDGTEFDSSYKRNEPAEFEVSQLIKGWTEALQLMPVGSKWQLFIPSDLAYGERGAGGTIPPNSALIFELELLSIQPAK
jgi:FKBP-type peptidyl-prolyl cis-trans isomerase FklB